jgi:hypothetical protein
MVEPQQLVEEANHARIVGVRVLLQVSEGCRCELGIRAFSFRWLASAAMNAQRVEPGQ